MTIAVIERRKMHSTRKILNFFDKNLSGKKIAIRGLSFKPDTDDSREAPAWKIIKQRLEKGVQISAFDPEAVKNVHSLLGESIGFEWVRYETLPDADAGAIQTEWTLFRGPDFDWMKRLMQQPVIFDGRNIYDPETMKKSVFSMTAWVKK